MGGRVLREFPTTWTQRSSGQATGRSTSSREASIGSLILRNVRPSVVRIPDQYPTGREYRTISTMQSNTLTDTPISLRKVSTTDLTTGRSRSTQEPPHRSHVLLGIGGLVVPPNQGREDQKSCYRRTSHEQT